jgi:hypothetical protein
VERAAFCYSRQQRSSLRRVASRARRRGQLAPQGHGDPDRWCGPGHHPLVGAADGSGANTSNQHMIEGRRQRRGQGARNYHDADCHHFVYAIDTKKDEISRALSRHDRRYRHQFSHAIRDCLCIPRIATFLNQVSGGIIKRHALGIRRIPSTG